MIWRKREGESFRIGINYNRDEYTVLLLGICLPVFIPEYGIFEDFNTDNLVQGWRYPVLIIRFRINKNRKAFKRIGFGYKYLGLSKVFKTREQIEDDELLRQGI